MTAPTGQNVSDELLSDFVNYMGDNHFFYRLRSAALTAALSVDEGSKHYVDDVARRVQGHSGLNVDLANKVYHFLCKRHLATPDDSDAIERAQANWERRISKSLNSMCSELGLPLATRRTDVAQFDLAEHWTELSSYSVPLDNIRPIYAAKDFLDVVLSVRSPNLNSLWPGRTLNLMLPVPTLEQLKRDFMELAALSRPQYGLDDLKSSNPAAVQYFRESAHSARAILTHCRHAAACRYFARLGVPPTLRAAFYARMLDVPIGDVVEMRQLRLKFQHLKAAVLRYDLFVDLLLFNDIRQTAANDDQYFVFEDYIYQVLLCFFRDTSVLEHFTQTCASPPQACLRAHVGGSRETAWVAYPPNGLVPFHGFAFLVAPLCFVFDDVVQLYYAFHSLYTRYFYKLYCLSAGGDGMLALCALFENLLARHCAAVADHFAQLQLCPLRFTFKWMFRLFSGYLVPSQVLVLWDRILAFDSMFLLPLLAVAIFMFRAKNLLTADTQPAIEAILADLNSLQVIPLLHMILSCDS